MEYLTTILILSVILCQTSFIIGTSLLLIALAKDITNELHSINAVEANQLELTNTLRNSIKLQSKAKKYFGKRNPCIEQSKIKFGLFYCRLIQKLCDAYEFNITIHFLWGIITICGILLMLQIELVEYHSFICWFQHVIFFLHYFVWFILVWSCIQSRYRSEFSHSAVLPVWFDFFVLWIWWESIYGIWEIEWYDLQFPMVSISNTNSTNSTDDYDWRSITCGFARFCKFFMLSESVYKC